MPEEIKQNELAPATESQTSLDKVMEALQAKVLGEGGVVSSEDTGFEKAIAGIKEAGVATGQRLESQAEREIAFATGQANIGRERALSKAGGFGQQKVALKLLEESNIKYIGDLQRQKDDALLANDAQTASQVAGLQVEAMRYEQQAKQQYFNNLLGMANLVQGQETEERMASQFTQNLQLQRDQMEEANRRTAAGLAAEYGVTIEEGDTLESVVSRIAPIVTAEKRAYLQSLVKTAKEEQEYADYDLLLETAIRTGGKDEKGLPPMMAAMNVFESLKASGLKVNESTLIRLQKRAREMQIQVDSSNRIQALEAQLSAQASIEWERAVSAGEVGPTPSGAITAESTTPYFGVGQTQQSQQYSVSPSSTQNEMYGSFYGSLFGE